ncbi:dihydrofolate synthase [Mariprofundus aestuarium]|uniref:Dihydrofolate synthase n=1 Tax=Mariprofundus aestuarium TaxID=1921086 RepID=A0A2K8L188_MARES|nr:cyanophycin synthetase [Mariprofundus aestuarium]ATX80842.1 dihydrofolate synthase [Mariprofundus aestuarium]
MTAKPQSIEQWLSELGNPSADRDYKPGHERLRRLLSHIHPYRPKLRIRVAGTNGKGSTSSMLAAALQQACNLKVGLYTSPHILEFNERIRINGIPVKTSELEQSLSHLMPHALAYGTSYFETATAVALDLFSRVNVDVEILEAGVGARLDATTAFPAEMALITPIGLDHQSWLGDTLKEIAREKAHAMAGCKLSISAPQNPEVAGELSAFNAGLQFCEISDWPKLVTSGKHQRINASLAYAAVRLLAEHEMISCDLAQARAAIASCKVPGRLQKIEIGPANIWLDAAHNRHAIEALLPSLKAIADPFDAILVFTREDRSLDDCLPLLAPFARSVVTKSEGDAPITALQKQLSQHPQGSFLVLGSFITVAEILRHRDKLPE